MLIGPVQKICIHIYSAGGNSIAGLPVKQILYFCDTQKVFFFPFFFFKKKKNKNRM